MDGLLDFGDDLRFLEIYKRLCRHIFYKHPQMVGEHIYLWRMHGECSSTPKMRRTRMNNLRSKLSNLKNACHIFRHYLRWPYPMYKPSQFDSFNHAIFVEFPIWWYIAPTIVNAFLESYDLTGKTIIPFATSGGSGMGKTNEALKPSCTGATLLEGKVWKSTAKKEELSVWADSLACR